MSEKKERWQLLLGWSADLALGRLALLKNCSSDAAPDVEATPPPFWERIHRGFHRAKVPGGWIVSEGKRAYSRGLCFVPDPKHEWELPGGGDE